MSCITSADDDYCRCQGLESLAKVLQNESTTSSEIVFKFPLKETCVFARDLFAGFPPFNKISYLCNLTCKSIEISNKIFAKDFQRLVFSHSKISSLLNLLPAVEQEILQNTLHIQQNI